jgi:hypothetical protein
VEGIQIVQVLSVKHFLLLKRPNVARASNCTRPQAVYSRVPGP